VGNTFTDDGWDQYVRWQQLDRKTLKKINSLLNDIARNGHDGIGKSEQLKHEWQGWWSKRIDEKNRLVYRILDNGDVEIAACMGHYDN
jgi:toxin YoeB